MQQSYLWDTNGYIVQMNNFQQMKGMRLFLSLGVPNIQQSVLHFEGLARVAERQFEKGCFLVVKKLFLT